MFGIFKRRGRSLEARLQQFFSNLQTIDATALGPDDRDALQSALTYVESALRPFWAESVVLNIEKATGVAIDHETRAQIVEACENLPSDTTLKSGIELGDHHQLAGIFHPFVIGALVGYSRACGEHGLTPPTSSFALEEWLQDVELYQHMEAVERVSGRAVQCSA